MTPTSGPAASEHEAVATPHALSDAPTVAIVVATSSVALTGAGLGMVAARLAGSPLALPCPMDALFGLACPACGMWRGAIGLARWDAAVMAEQWSAIAVGAVLSLAALASGVAWARRRWLSGRSARLLAGALGVTMAINWVVQLSRVL